MPTPKKSTQKITVRRKVNPLWSGPLSSSESGGVTQSLLSRFLVCRERFRIQVIEGLKPHERFSHRLEYGNMFHLCEENHARGDDWRDALRRYCNDLLERYRDDKVEIQKWYSCCNVQFPIYLEHKSQIGEEEGRKSIMQEMNFCVPYRLPSNRIVHLRGKWDGASLYGKKLYLDEHKAKGDPDKEALKRQLLYDNQTMLYLVALQRGESMEFYHTFKAKLCGVRYNVVKRPLSGGKGTIKKRKATKGNRRMGKSGRMIGKPGKPAETSAEYYNRLGGIMREVPEQFFMRFRVEVSQRDIDNYVRKTLNPVLEQLCDWYEWVSSPEGLKDPFANPIHWQHPFGIYSPMNEGKVSDYDNYILTGNKTGLTRVDTLFPELK